MARLPFLGLAMVALAAVLAGGCMRVKSDPIEVRPIEVKPIEININVRVKVDRELDGFFDDLDRSDTTIKK